MGRMIGYARVSMSDQDVRLQWEALRRAGCQEPLIFCDTASGAKTAHPGLEALLTGVSPGRPAGGLAVRSPGALDDASRGVDRGVTPTAGGVSLLERWRHRYHHGVR